jgi:predicted nuclease of predicted toxin-antitoxin system
MTIWLDAHLSPILAPWIQEEFGCTCVSFRSLQFQSTEDRKVFYAARLANAVIVSKDSDFPDLLRLLGPPPKVIWLRCGNRTNREMKEFLKATFQDALRIIKAEDLVEIKDA